MIWTVVAIVATIVFTAPLLGSFQIAWGTFVAPALACAMLSGAGCFYSRWRRDPRLASGLLCTAHCLCGGRGRLLYCGAPTRPCGILDSTLLTALGLDWKSPLAWMNDFSRDLRSAAPDLSQPHPATRPRCAWLFQAAFCGCGSTRLRSSLRCRFHCGLASCRQPVRSPTMARPGSSRILPAVSTSWPVFYGLRDGHFVCWSQSTRGIITFPYPCRACRYRGDRALAHCKLCGGSSSPQYGDARGHPSTARTICRRARAGLARRALPCCWRGRWRPRPRAGRVR